MPKKSSQATDITFIPLYRGEVVCPYCGEENTFEEECGEPEDMYCCSCDKEFIIKYDDLKKKGKKW